MDDLVSADGGGIWFPGVAGALGGFEAFQHRYDHPDPDPATEPGQHPPSDRPMVIDVRGRHAELRQLLLPVPGVSFLGGGQLEEDVAVFLIGSFGQLSIQVDILEFPRDVAPVPPGSGLRPPPGRQASEEAASDPGPSVGILPHAHILPRPGRATPRKIDGLCRVVQLTSAAITAAGGRGRSNSGLCGVR
jgi:hypothetical protein